MKVLVALLSACGLLVVTAGMAAAPDQGPRPGDMSPPNVWVQNRGQDEAIPVTLVNAGPPLSVRLVQLTSGGVEPVMTRAARQQWEYMQVRITANQDAAAELNAAGAEGWEATGTTLPTTGGTLVILKRPR